MFLGKLSCYDIVKTMSKAVNDSNGIKFITFIIKPTFYLGIWHFNVMKFFKHYALLNLIKNKKLGKKEL